MKSLIGITARHIFGRPSTYLIAGFLCLGMSLGIGGYVLASSTSNFSQTISAGSLAVDIVDASFVTVGSPGVAMDSQTFSFACHASTGTFGTTTQQIYVANPDAADSGWTVSLAASNVTDVWASAGTDYDFNDPSDSGCTDGGDADSLAGQMTVDPSGGVIDTGQCASCTTGSISPGSQSSFNQGTIDSITLLTAAAGSDDVGDWTFQTITISQTIPAEQPVAADYNINMTLSILAS